MAFNFNWSPLAADAEFYRRAQELLTSALNKYPKPPIIVDDILVTEFNLGSVPPDLEILEIGDLAEDRFRGIFKMCYSGDASSRYAQEFRYVWFCGSVVLLYLSRALVIVEHLEHGGPGLTKSRSTLSCSCTEQDFLFNPPRPSSRCTRSRVRF